MSARSSHKTTRKPAPISLSEDEAIESASEEEIELDLNDWQPPSELWPDYAEIRGIKSISTKYWIICKPDEWKASLYNKDKTKRWVNFKNVRKLWSTQLNEVQISYVILRSMRSKRKLRELGVPENAILYIGLRSTEGEVVKFMKKWAEEDILITDFTKVIKKTPEHKRMLLLTRIRSLLHVMDDDDLVSLEKKLSIIKLEKKIQCHLNPEEIKAARR